MKKHLTIENITSAEKLGVAVKRLRKQQGLGQADLASMMNMRQPTISDIENGRGTLDSFFKIIQALKVNLAVSTSKTIATDSKNSKAKEVLDLIYE
ncbi:helix-turn-helix domain-containing protein [Bacteriovoracaceae bacterium]|jgi:transcriptional regulator with XRE-family HTH domain|nr:helix-turn-helix domain-containing protein [Bacteriovoracaceae bacterium]